MHCIMLCNFQMIVPNGLNGIYDIYIKKGNFYNLIDCIYLNMTVTDLSHFRLLFKYQGPTYVSLSPYCMMLNN